MNISPISNSLTKFIGSGMMDYAYMENRKYEIDLSLGVNPLGCSQKVIRYFRDKNINFSNYSEVASETLRNKIGNIYGFNKEEIILGAGVSELLHFCFLTFMNPGEKVLIPEISFPAFEYLAILTHGIPKFIPFNSTFDLEYDKIPNLIKEFTKIVVLCNPNNPTGKTINAEKIIKIIKSFPDAVFLADEANIDFGGISLLPWAKQLKTL
jgi:histidinol-phosphate aminotransferase